MFRGTMIDELVASVERVEEHVLLADGMIWKTVRRYPNGASTLFFEVAPATPQENSHIVAA